MSCFFAVRLPDSYVHRAVKPAAVVLALAAPVVVEARPPQV